MKYQALILMPDYCGQGLFRSEETAGAFTARLEEMCRVHPEWLWMPLLNGRPAPELYEMREEVYNERSDMDNFEPIVVEEQGVAQVMRFAYEYVLGRYVSDVRCIMKIDHAEHPPETIPSMLMPILTGEAEATLGNLWYREGMLGEKEAQADAWMADMCQKYMSNPFPISHAHGYQAYSAASFPMIYKRAMDIMQRAEQIIGDQLRWGGDLCFLLAADNLTGLKEIRIPAEVERKRPGKKNEDQLKAWETVFRASKELA